MRSSDIVAVRRSLLDDHALELEPVIPWYRRFEKWVLRQVLCPVFSLFGTLGKPTVSIYDEDHGHYWSHARINAHRKTDVNHAQPLVKLYWLIGPRSRFTELTLKVNHSDDMLVELVAVIPFVGAMWLGFNSSRLQRWLAKTEWLPATLRKGSCATGISFHHQTLWFCVLNPDDYDRDLSRWWHKTTFTVPWEPRHQKTEILTFDTFEPVFTDTSLNWYQWKWKRFKDWWTKTDSKGSTFFDTYDERKAVEASVSQTFSYRYVTDALVVQDVVATVHIERRVWGWTALPFIRKSVMSIDVTFSEELGAKRGSWKGGCTGCGYTINPGETAEQCLRRMESERRFER